MTPDQRQRAAALEGRERLPAARDLLRLMVAIDKRPPVVVTKGAPAK